MERTLLKDVKSKIGSEVLVKGWIQELRNLNKIKFLILRDRSGVMQCVALKSQTKPDSFDLINSFSRESVIEVIGVVTENKESRWGVEILIDTVKLLSVAETIPIDNSDKSTTELEKRIDYRFLDTRNLKENAIFRIRGKIVRIVTDFFDDEGFTYISTPKITRIGVESGAALFNVNYFNSTVYLSQSPQVYKQMFVAGGFERVYEIGVVFRAENSNTTRHLTEFTGIDFEMGFIKGFEDVMDTIEKMLMNLLERLQKECVRELEILGVKILKPVKIPRIHMEDAKKYLASKGKIYSPNDDLDPEGERLLGEYAIEKFGSEFIFITHYPWVVRPFYHMRPPDRPDLTYSFDLLHKGVEIATGAQREHRIEVLRKQTKEKGLDLEDMKEYQDIFKYGIPPHGGVGFGLDRLTQRLLGLSNIREAVLLPRDPKRTRP